MGNSKQIPLKRWFLLLLVTLAVIAVLWIVSYLPYPGLYVFTLSIMERIGSSNLNINNVFRLKITIFSFLASGIIVLLLILLRKASKHFSLKLLEMLLAVGIFYVTVMTVLMVIGLWLDCCFVTTDWCRYHPIARVGYFFYYWSY
ncbi:hypothetical protein JXM67_15080 [candidate division WOR-3 bacterium]|nr:hypothetical protein [candidate division WOR-3 bacterium]